MAAWIGPAIVAAVISALVTGVGWLVSERQAERRETKRRQERVVDMQTALLAEIRASRHRLGSLSDYGAAIDRAIAEQENYTPFVPKQVQPALFNAVLNEIHILPTDVIDPIVVYYRQRSVIANLADDLRSDRFETLDQTRKRLLYRDFVQLLQEADILALAAERTLYESLNIRGGGSSAPRSGGEPDAEGDSDLASRSDP